MESDTFCGNFIVKIRKEISGAFMGKTVNKISRKSPYY